MVLSTAFMSKTGVTLFFKQEKETIGVTSLILLLFIVCCEKRSQRGATTSARGYQELIKYSVEPADEFDQFSTN